MTIDEKAFSSAKEQYWFMHDTDENLKEFIEAYESARSEAQQPVRDDILLRVIETAIFFESEQHPEPDSFGGQAVAVLKAIRPYLRTKAPASPVLDTKLIALLEKLSCLGNGEIPGNSIGNVMAQEALEMAKNPPYITAPASQGDGGIGSPIRYTDGSLSREYEEHKPAPSVSLWQPIESAPKTTESILVYCSFRKNIYVVTWYKEVSAWYHFGGPAYLLNEEPTHWMPLPAAPVEVKP